MRCNFGCQVEKSGGSPFTKILDVVTTIQTRTAARSSQDWRKLTAGGRNERVLPEVRYAPRHDQFRQIARLVPPGIRLVQRAARGNSRLVDRSRLAPGLCG